MSEPLTTVLEQWTYRARSRTDPFAETAAVALAEAEAWMKANTWYTPDGRHAVCSECDNLFEPLNTRAGNRQHLCSRECATSRKRRRDRERLARKRRLGR